jgi:hypothetical protein
MSTSTATADIVPTAADLRRAWISAIELFEPGDDLELLKLQNASARFLDSEWLPIALGQGWDELELWGSFPAPIEFARRRYDAMVGERSRAPIAQVGANKRRYGYGGDETSEAVNAAGPGQGGNGRLSEIRTASATSSQPSAGWPEPYRGGRLYGVSASLFDRMVTEKVMPKPKRFARRVIWDRWRLDEALSEMPERG